MKLQITHETSYAYAAPVFLEPHTLRFRPRDTAYLTVESFELSVVAEPSGRRQVVDEESNAVDFCWFSGTTERLDLRAVSTVSIADYNPFAFILHPVRFNQLPFEYTPQQSAPLRAYLDGPAVPAQLARYGQELQASASGNTLQYLTDLTTGIHGDFGVVYREVGPPMSPAETFGLREGSCRDLAWMMIALLRAQGIAARFTSGYFYFEMDEPAYELHAWAEVFLPGAGWVGFDPSHGIMAGNAHLPIASSADHRNTMPVSGGIRGSAASTLTAALSIVVC